MKLYLISKIQGMNDQIKEMRTFKDLWEHENKLTRDYDFQLSRWLYLCQYIGDVELLDVSLQLQMAEC